MDLFRVFVLISQFLFHFNLLNLNLIHFEKNSEYSHTKRNKKQQQTIKTKTKPSKMIRMESMSEFDT